LTVPGDENRSQGGGAGEGGGGGGGVGSGGGGGGGKGAAEGAAAEQPPGMGTTVGSHAAGVDWAGSEGPEEREPAGGGHGDVAFGAPAEVATAHLSLVTRDEQDVTQEASDLGQRGVKGASSGVFAEAFASGAPAAGAGPERAVGLVVSVPVVAAPPDPNADPQNRSLQSNSASSAALGRVAARAGLRSMSQSAASQGRQGVKQRHLGPGDPQHRRGVQHGHERPAPRASTSVESAASVAGSRPGRAGGASMEPAHWAQQQAGGAGRRVTTRINKHGGSGNESTSSKTGGTYRYSDDASKRAAAARAQSRLRRAPDHLVAKHGPGAGDVDLKGRSSPDQSSSNSKFAGLKRLPLSTTSRNRMPARAPAGARHKTAARRGALDLWIPPALLVREPSQPPDGSERLGRDASWEHVRAALHRLRVQRDALRRWRGGSRPAATPRPRHDGPADTGNDSEALEPSRDARTEEDTGIAFPGSPGWAAPAARDSSYAKAREHLLSEHTLSMAGPEALDLVLRSSGL